MACCKPPNRWVPYFAGWTAFTPTIPKMYWNVRSVEQRTLAMAEQIHKLICYADMLGGKITENREAIEELSEAFEKFIESGFDDYYRDQVIAWIDEHLTWIFENVAKQVFFGLTMDGYFCAYIPESWSDIEFDTGMVYGQFDYGRLILRFNADGSGVIDNTGRYDDVARQQIEQIMERLTRTERTLYTPMSAGGEI